MKYIKVISIILILGIVAIFIVLFNKNIVITQNDSVITENETKYTFKNLRIATSSNGSDYSKNLNYFNHMYYKKLDNYNDYINFKNIYSNITEMSEADFNDKFMIITIVENTSMLKLTLKDVYVIDDTLYIGLIRVSNSEVFDESNNTICMIIDKSLNRDNVEVFKTIENKNFMTKYEDIKKLPLDYTIEQALNDGCLVTVNNTTENKELFNEFKENILNSSDSEIRMVRFDDGIVIWDLKYSSQDKKFYLCIDSTRVKTIQMPSPIRDEYESYDWSYNYYEFTDMELTETSYGLQRYELKNSDSIDYMELYM